MSAGWKMGQNGTAALFSDPAFLLKEYLEESEEKDGIRSLWNNKGKFPVFPLKKAPPGCIAAEPYA